MTSNTDLTRRIYETFAGDDVEAFLAALDNKIEWTEAAGFPYAGTYVGPEAVMEGVVMRLATEWARFEVTPDRFVAEGDTVVATGSYEGTFQATGRSFSARFAHVWELRNGAVVRFEQIVDTAKVAEALT